VGINDDVSHRSLPYDARFDIEPDDVTRALFFGLGADGTVSANKATIKIIGEETTRFAQGYFEYDSRKSGSTTISHLRFGPRPIRSTYLVRRAQFVASTTRSSLERRDVLARRCRARRCCSTPPSRPSGCGTRCRARCRRGSIEQRCRLFVIDGYGVAERAGLGRAHQHRDAGVLLRAGRRAADGRGDGAHRRSIEQTYGRRGPEVVKRNVAALDAALAELHEVPVPATVTATRVKPADGAGCGAGDFVQRVTRLLLEGRGDELPVSAFPPDGTWPTGTSKFEKRAIARTIPIWQPELCIQCNFCVMICPHAAIQAKVFDARGAGRRARGLPRRAGELRARHGSPALRGAGGARGLHRLRALRRGLPGQGRLKPRARRSSMSRWRRTARRARGVRVLRAGAVGAARGAQARQALGGAAAAAVRVLGACAGCGETPYVRLLTQLFGDHLVIANATGCSSIYGGNLPTTPYTTDADGRGPAWANSLFEDNAEFGLGHAAGHRRAAEQAKALLAAVAGRLPGSWSTRWSRRRGRGVVRGAARTRGELKTALASDPSPEARALLAVADGAGAQERVDRRRRRLGLRHRLRRPRPRAGVAPQGERAGARHRGVLEHRRPAVEGDAAGRGGEVRDGRQGVAQEGPGPLAMSYGHVYVASIALQARARRPSKAFQEAERHPGPSLIIAHSPCIAHGYDLVKSPTQQKRAVDSGMWPLYRYDPARPRRGAAGARLGPAQARRRGVHAARGAVPHGRAALAGALRRAARRGARRWPRSTSR
jgi:pyruvate-ferredoxin/flavodoxin oxidoreductase